MIEHGRAEEEAALTLGASGWRTFRTVTLRNVRWALLYCVLLCNARAMGEFGAVTVVSGKIRSQSTAMPLMIEMLYNEYRRAEGDADGALPVAAQNPPLRRAGGIIGERPVANQSTFFALVPTSALIGDRVIADRRRRAIALSVR